MIQDIFNFRCYRWHGRAEVRAQTSAIGSKADSVRGSFFLFALFAISSSLCLQPANADDWGYEQTEKIDDSVGSVKELDAVAGQLDSPLLKMDDKELVKESPAKQESKAPEIKDQKLKRAIDYWLQLYGLVAPIDKNGKLIEGGDLSKNLSEKQKIRFAHYLAKNKHTDPATLAVVDYWPDLEKRIKDLDQRGNYRLLFRALLRVRAQSKTIHSE
ncbi:MAG: hypothetical protein K8F91_09160, partial [Candidatus Obscuribacterales bacterium]|nr:hypothetical protein [Candidatus Obscuribacterales bacterium]